MDTPLSALSAPQSHSRTQRPSSSLSLVRPVSSASLRPQSRLSRPNSRISRPATRQANRLLLPCQSLVKQVTGLSSNNDPEKFRLASDFALKNLEHATKGGASVDMNAMDKKIMGYVQKARVNIQDNLADALHQAYDRLKDQVKCLTDIDEEIKPAHISDHLQLLALLCVVPSRSTLAFADAYRNTKPFKIEPPVSWNAIFTEEPFEGQHWEGVYGLPPGSTIEGWEIRSNRSTSSLSSWDESASLDKEDDDSRSSLNKSSSSLSETPVIIHRGTHSHSRAPGSLNVMEKLKARQYWRDEWRIGIDINRPFDFGDPSTLGPAILRVLGEKATLSLVGLDHEKWIHERDAVREVLMCLQGRKNIMIYTTTDTFTSVPSPIAPRLLHFTLTTQSSILSAFAQVTTTVCHLRKFASAIIYNASSARHSSPSTTDLLSHGIMSRTVEAFADALDAQIRAFDAWCAAEEESICRASAGVGEPLVVSLLSMEKHVRDVFAGTFDVLINLLHRIISSVCQSRDRRDLVVWNLANMPTRIPPSAVSALLLDLLIEASAEQASMGNTKTSDALVAVFVKTVEPLWSMLGGWLLDGMPVRTPWSSADEQILDQEFFIEDNELQIMSPNFWADGYVLRKSAILEEPRKDQSAVPSFLEPAISHILGAGKAVGLLRMAGPRFFAGLSEHAISQRWSTFAALLETDITVARHSQSLSRLISEEISPHCLAAGVRLSHFLTEECDLARHTTAIHGLFLMTQGDDISRFTDILFTKMDSQQSWHDFHVLNSAFRDVVESSWLNWIEPSLVRLSYRGNEAASVPTSMEAISGLLVEYAVPFPLTYIFTPNVLQNYRSIFVFLLQVRRAKNVLERMFLEGVVADIRMRRELKVFFAIRGKLSWFVNVLINFLTTYVIHVQLSKSNNFNGANPLDDMITAHNDYLKMLMSKCFLHSSTSEILKAILSVLNMCLHFRSVFTAFVGNTNLDTRPSVNMRRHRSRRQRRLRNNVIGFSRPHIDPESDDDSDTDIEVQNEVAEAPSTSFSLAPSSTEANIPEQLERLSSELDRLVRYIRRGAESLAGGTSDVAYAFGILAFSLDDWDS